MWVKSRTISSPPQSRALDRLAREIGIDDIILNILTPQVFSFNSRPLWLRVLAIEAAKWIANDEIIKCLWNALGSSNRDISLRACTSLVSLNARDYEKAVIKTLFRFPEQAPTISTQIGAAGGGDVLHILEPFLDRLPNYTVTNIVTLAERSSDKSLLPVIIEKLHLHRNDEEAGSLLRAIGNLGGPDEKAEVIPYLSHKVGFLRVQAAKALGRIGELSDIPLIEPLLSDRNWWFRFRAAETIVRLANGDNALLEQLVDKQEDKYAAEILRHVISEKNWGGV
ncbi:MAG: HEAT repeat domain-containing protein [Gammaproteobacteria bacterium]